MDLGLFEGFLWIFFQISMRSHYCKLITQMHLSLMINPSVLFHGLVIRRLLIFVKPQWFFFLLITNVSILIFELYTCFFNGWINSMKHTKAKPLEMDGLQFNSNQQDASTDVYQKIYTKSKEDNVFSSKTTWTQTTEREAVILLTSVV